ncbi:cytochrome c-type biogenesis protein [Brevundimonas sp. VNH65]|uniref:cytochrome c-type biogenesis protein n=1 Tax=Brevundimonas sp. VNH65 TaxID=3400917 RepID=UPI003C02F715
MATAFALLLSTSAMAQEPAAAPETPLTDAAQEARARALFQEVRCVVCQHESIADSPAGIAADMRRLVREEIAAGKTDAAVRQDLVRRWGDYILFRPPFRWSTLVLWLGPFALILGGAVLLWRRRPGAVMTAEPLSDEEERRLADLLTPETDRPDPDANRPHD